MLNAIIFDLDDTLLNWNTREMDWFDADRQHLQGVYAYVTRQHPLPDFESFVDLVQALTVDAWLEGGRTLQAPNLGHVLAEALLRLNVPADKIDVTACLEAYNWRGMPGVRPFPEVPDVLQTLQASGLKLGLITNAYQPMWMRDRELEAAGLSPDWFACRTSSADVGYLKPHPAVFAHTLDTLGVQPQEAVFVGDNLEADIVGASRAGMKAVLRRSNETGESAREFLPDAEIDSLQELFGWLDRWFYGWQDGR
ncbi:MAG: TIGR02253 family HAD-type hydrolase [Anaerolineae bacterium]